VQVALFLDGGIFGCDSFALPNQRSEIHPMPAALRPKIFPGPRRASSGNLFRWLGVAVFMLCAGFGDLLAATVVLDPGHGGFDPGGVPGQRYSEKAAALDIALRVRAGLNARGHRVVMTRATDVFVGLSERVSISKRTSGSPVFVSIHLNSAPNKDATGVETYYYSSKSARLARAIHQQVLGVAGSPDRGVRRARFYVLRYNTRPSVLLELGFLTNATEGAKISRSAKHRQKLADAVVSGICSVVR
jgi:N-acetylmuramoyl-L-alanine amidase